MKTIRDQLFSYSDFWFYFKNETRTPELSRHDSESTGTLYPRRDSSVYHWWMTRQKQFHTRHKSKHEQNLKHSEDPHLFLICTHRPKERKGRQKTAQRIKKQPILIAQRKQKLSRNLKVRMSRDKIR